MTNAGVYRTAVLAYGILLVIVGIVYLVVALGTNFCGFRWTIETNYVCSTTQALDDVDDLGYGDTCPGQTSKNVFTTSLLTGLVLLTLGISYLVQTIGEYDERTTTATLVYADTLEQIEQRFRTSRWITWSVAFAIHFATASFGSSIRDPWHVAALSVLGATSMHFYQSYNEAINSIQSLVFDDQQAPLVDKDRTTAIERYTGRAHGWVLTLVVLAFIALDWFWHLASSARSPSVSTCASAIPIGTIVVYAITHLIILRVTNYAPSTMNVFDREAAFMVPAIITFGGTAVLQLTCARASACPSASAMPLEAFK